MPIDATPGGPTANSYVTLDEAMEYAAGRLHTSAWDALSSEDKEKSLIMATRLIDRFVCFLGTSATTTQSLRFPMTGLYEITGRLVLDDEIPPAVREATIELALLLASNDYTAPSDATVQGLTKLKAGPVELGFRDDVASRSLIDTLVRPMLPSAWLCPTAEETLAVNNRKASFRVL